MKWVIRCLCGAVLTAALVTAIAEPPAERPEQYEHVPMPPGFQVVVSEQEGPVFADAQGKTLYTWPVKALRNGSVGERKKQPSCDATRYTETAGLMSPYPPGLILPEVDKRPSCLDVWPAVIATQDAKPVGKWTVVERKDGRRQWAYDGYALYTSVLDDLPGDVNGGTFRKTSGDAPGERKPIGPPPLVPPQLKVVPLLSGRMLTTSEGYSVYIYDKDPPGKSSCTGACLEQWQPVTAPAYALGSSKGSSDFTVIERQPGVFQWSFRGQPLYTHVADEYSRSMRGSDEPGWHNAYTQHAPKAPADFTVQETAAGLVLADRQGKTVYLYNCGDDALDQLACDHPDSPQVYRFAVCGGGDPKACLQRFPYVLASDGAQSAQESGSRVWSVLSIDPLTGKRVEPGNAGALRVWAFRKRPVYTNYRDKQAGDLQGDSWGEFYGYRNGYKAFWLRDDFGSGVE